MKTLKDRVSWLDALETTASVALAIGALTKNYWLIFIGLLLTQTTQSLICSRLEEMIIELDSNR